MVTPPPPAPGSQTQVARDTSFILNPGGTDNITGGIGLALSPPYIAAVGTLDTEIWLQDGESACDCDLLVAVISLDTGVAIGPIQTVHLQMTASVMLQNPTDPGKYAVRIQRKVSTKPVKGWGKVIFIAS